MSPPQKTQDRQGQARYFDLLVPHFLPFLCLLCVPLGSHSDMKEKAKKDGKPTTRDTRLFHPVLDCFVSSTKKQGGMVTCRPIQRHLRHWDPDGVGVTPTTGGRFFCPVRTPRPHQAAKQMCIRMP